LYFFPSGYGGLSVVEGGLANLCFITTERSIKDASGDPARVFEQTVMRNPGARHTLARAQVVGKWLSAGPLVFGHRKLQRDGIIAVGDAAGMIDPFTGAGIQIAIRSGEALADCISHVLGNARSLQDLSDPVCNLSSGFAAGHSPIAGEVNRLYAAHYRAEFRSRMAVAGVLRVAAFSPRAAGLLASLFTAAPGLVNRAFKSTRLGRPFGPPPSVPPSQNMELSRSDGVSTHKASTTPGR